MTQPGHEFVEGVHPQARVGGPPEDREWIKARTPCVLPIIKRALCRRVRGVDRARPCTCVCQARSPGVVLPCVEPTHPIGQKPNAPRPSHDSCCPLGGEHEA